MNLNAIDGLTLTGNVRGGTLSKSGGAVLDLTAAVVDIDTLNVFGGTVNDQATASSVYNNVNVSAKSVFQGTNGSYGNLTSRATITIVDGVVTNIGGGFLSASRGDLFGNITTEHVGGAAADNNGSAYNSVLVLKDMTSQTGHKGDIVNKGTLLIDGSNLSMTGSLNPNPDNSYDYARLTLKSSSVEMTGDINATRYRKSVDDPADKIVWDGGWFAMQDSTLTSKTGAMNIAAKTQGIAWNGSSTDVTKTDVRFYGNVVTAYTGMTMDLEFVGGTVGGMVGSIDKGNQFTVLQGGMTFTGKGSDSSIDFVSNTLQARDAMTISLTFQNAMNKNTLTTTQGTLDFTGILQDSTVNGSGFFSNKLTSYGNMALTLDGGGVIYGNTFFTSAGSMHLSGHLDIDGQTRSQKVNENTFVAYGDVVINNSFEISTFNNNLIQSGKDNLSLNGNIITNTAIGTTASTVNDNQGNTLIAARRFTNTAFMSLGSDSSISAQIWNLSADAVIYDGGVTLKAPVNAGIIWKDTQKLTLSGGDHSVGTLTLNNGTFTLDKEATATGLNVTGTSLTTGALHLLNSSTLTLNGIEQIGTVVLSGNTIDATRQGSVLSISSHNSHIANLQIAGNSILSLDKGHLSIDILNKNTTLTGGKISANTGDLTLGKTSTNGKFSGSFSATSGNIYLGTAGLVNMDEVTLSAGVSLYNKSGLTLGTGSSVSAANWEVQANATLTNSGVQLRSGLKMKGNLTLSGVNNDSVWNSWLAGKLNISGMNFQQKTDKLSELMLEHSINLGNVSSLNLTGTGTVPTLILNNLNATSQSVRTGLIEDGYLNLSMTNSTLNANKIQLLGNLSLTSGSILNANGALYLLGGISIDHSTISSMGSGNILLGSLVSPGVHMGSISQLRNSTLNASGYNLSIEGSIDAGIVSNGSIAGNTILAANLKLNPSNVSTLTFGAGNVFTIAQSTTVMGSSLVFDDGDSTNTHDFGQLGNTTGVGNVSLTLASKGILQMSGLLMNSGALTVRDQSTLNVDGQLDAGGNVILANNATLSTYAATLRKDLTMGAGSTMTTRGNYAHMGGNLRIEEDSMLTINGDLSAQGTQINVSGTDGANLSHLYVSGAMALNAPIDTGGTPSSMNISNARLSASIISLNSSSLLMLDQADVTLFNNGRIVLNDTSNAFISSTTIHSGGLRHSGFGLMSLHDVTFEDIYGRVYLSSGETTMTGQIWFKDANAPGTIVYGGGLTIGDTSQGSVQTDYLGLVTLNSGNVTLNEVAKLDRIESRNGSGVRQLNISHLIDSGITRLQTVEIGNLLIEQSLNLAIGEGRTLTLDNLTGSNSLLLSGNGDMRLGRINEDYTGNIQWSGSNIKLLTDNALGNSGTLTVTGNTQVMLDVSGTSLHQKDIGIENSLGTLSIGNDTMTSFTGTFRVSGTLEKMGAGKVVLNDATPGIPSWVNNITVQGGSLDLMRIGINGLTGNLLLENDGSLMLSGVKSDNVTDIILRGTGALTLSNGSAIKSVSMSDFSQGSLILKEGSSLSLGTLFKTMGDAVVSVDHASMMIDGNITLTGSATNEWSMKNIFIQTPDTLTLDISKLAGGKIQSVNGGINTLEASNIHVKNSLSIDNGALIAQNLLLDGDLNLTGGSLAISTKTQLGNLSSFSLTEASGRSALGEINLNTSSLILSGKKNAPSLEVTGTLLGTYESTGTVRLSNMQFLGDVSLTNDHFYMTDSSVLSGGNVTLLGGTLTLSGVNTFGRLTLGVGVHNGVATTGVTMSTASGTASLIAANTYLISGTQTIGSNVKLTTDMWIQGGSTLDLTGNILANVADSISGNLTLENGSAILRNGSTLAGDLDLQSGTVELYSASVMGDFKFTGNLGVSRQLLVHGNAGIGALLIQGNASINVDAAQTLTVNGKIGGLTENATPGDLTKSGKGTISLTKSGNSGSLLVTDGVFKTTNKTDLTKDSIRFMGDVQADGSMSLDSAQIYLKNDTVDGKLIAKKNSFISMEGGTFRQGLQVEDYAKIALSGISVDESLESLGISASRYAELSIENSTIQYIGNFSTSGILNVDNSLVWTRNGKINLLGTEGLIHIHNNSTLQGVSLTIGNIGTYVFMSDSMFNLNGSSEIRGNLHMFANSKSNGLDYRDFGNIGNMALYGGAKITLGLEWNKGDSVPTVHDKHTSTEQFLITGNLTLSDDGMTKVNSFFIKDGTFKGKVLVEGGHNIFSMNNAAIDGILTMEGGKLTLDGAQNTVTGNATIGATAMIEQGSIFTAPETHITDSELTVEGTLDSNLYLEGGNATLTGANSAVKGKINIASGSFTYEGTAPVSMDSLNDIAFVSYMSSHRDLIVSTPWEINSVAAQAAGTILLNSQPGTTVSLTLHGALSGDSALTVKGSGNMYLTHKGTHTGNIYYNATGELYLTENDALGTAGTLYVGDENSADTDKLAHVLVKGTHSKNVMANNVLFTTIGDVLWTGSIYQDVLKKDGAYTLTISNHGSTIGSLTVEEGAYISQGSNRFNDVVAKKKSTAANPVSITLNQGDSIDGILMTGADSSITLIGLTTNLKNVGNAGTLNLQDGSSILVGGNFQSQGMVELKNSTLRILDEMRISGTGSLVTAAGNGASTFSTSKLTISGGGLDLSHGTNLVNVDSNMVVTGGTSSIRGALIIGDSLTIGSTDHNIAKLSLAPMGDTQSNLGVVTISDNGILVVGDVNSANTQTVKVNTISVNGTGKLTLANVNVNFNGGVGSLVLFGSDDAGYTTSNQVVLHNARLDGNISVNGYNVFNMNSNVDVTGNMDIAAASGLKLEGAGSLRFQGGINVVDGNLHIASPAGLSAASLHLTKSTSGISGKINISGASELSGSKMDMLDFLTGDIQQDFGSLGKLTIADGSIFTATGRDTGYKALLAGDIILQDNADVSLANLSDLKNIVLTGNVSMSGSPSFNTLNLTDTTIKGDLTLTGGTFNSKGINSVKTATVGGNTIVNILDGSLSAENLRLTDNVQMTISSQLKSGVILDGSGVSLTLNSGEYKGNQVPYKGFAITGDLTINSGEFVYIDGAIAGRIFLNGADAGEARIKILNDCPTYPENTLSMLNNGTIHVVAGKTLTVNGGINNKGTLIMEGEGNFDFASSGTHSGNMEYNGTGKLILSAENTLGNSGKLYLSQADGVIGHTANAYLDVRANQGKDMVAEHTQVVMTAIGQNGTSVIWNGAMDLNTLTLNEIIQSDGSRTHSNLTLASSGSSIGTLVLNNSSFRSNGGNKFGSINLSNNGNLWLSTGDEINGVMTSDSSIITLDGVTAHNIQGLTNRGILNLINNTSITVAGDMESTGELHMDSSALSVSRLTTLGLTSLKNSTLSGKMSVDVKGVVATIDGNVESSVNAGTLNINSGGQLSFLPTSGLGLATVTASSNFNMQAGSLGSVITGSLNVGGSMNMQGGDLTLNISGEKSSFLGIVSVQSGNLTLKAAQGDGQRSISASAISIDNEESYIELSNVNLKINEGNGTLVLNGGLDNPDKSYEQLHLANSLITGNVTINNHNSGTIAADATITGTATISGVLNLTGSGVLTLGNLAINKANASMSWDGGTLLVNGATTMTGGSLSLSSQKDSLGRLGTVAMNDSSTLTLKGKNGILTDRSTLVGNITMGRSGGNTLNLSHVKLTGDVTVEDTETTLANTFTMEDSDILGRLTMNGGIFNVQGTMNTATEASIGGSTHMVVKDGSTFKALTTIVNADAHLDILGTMDGSVHVAGGTASLGDATYAGRLMGDLKVSEGTFNYNHINGIIGGAIILTGASQTSTAMLNINATWNATNNLNMLGYGRVNITSADTLFNLSGKLTGNGILTVTGDGAMTLGATGDHETDIKYGAGMLTLNASNALGTKGTLMFTHQNTPASMTIGRTGVPDTIEQAKNLTGIDLNLTTLQNTVWKGTMILSSLNKNGAGTITLTGNGSSITNLNAAVGSFVSNGINTFTNLETNGGLIVLNAGATVNGTITTAASAGINENTIVLNGVVSSLASTVKAVNNAGVLILSGKTALIVAGAEDTPGTFTSTGSLTVKNSSLIVENTIQNSGNAGEVDTNAALLTETFLSNATVSFAGNLNIQGIVSTLENTSSTLSANSLTIKDSGKLSLTNGISHIKTKEGFSLLSGSSVVTGSLNSGSTTVNHGSLFQLNILGSTDSNLGAAAVYGQMAIESEDGNTRKVYASGGLFVSVGEESGDTDGHLKLSSIDLVLDNGMGTLSLVNANEDGPLRELAYFVNSSITGNVQIFGGNILHLERPTTVSGDLMVAGELLLQGGGSLLIKGSSSIDFGSITLQNKGTTFGSGDFSMFADTALNVHDGSLKISGEMTMDSGVKVTLDTSLAEHNFGSINNALIKNGAVFEATGLSSDNKALLAGNLTVSGDSTLTLTNIVHTGNVTIQNGAGNLFNMTDSSINGMLDVAGGSMTLTGTNYAREASISGNAEVTVNTGASLQVDTTVVKPTGLLIVEGTLNGALLLDGGNAVVNGDNASIASWVKVSSGTLTLTQAKENNPIGGDLIFNGATSDGSAHVLVGQEFAGGTWTMNGNLLMTGSGLLTLNGNMILNGSLSGSGRLAITGVGSTNFNHTGESSFSGDIDYSAGTLTLGHKNALGTAGSLNLNGNVNMTVTGDQSKNISGGNGHTLSMTTMEDIVWNGQMTIGTLKVQGSGLTLGAKQSNIGNLILESGEFVSNGTNTFGNVTLKAAGAEFNAGDHVTGNLVVGSAVNTGVFARFHNVTSSLTSVTNYGELTIDSRSALIVNGVFDSKGTLALSGNSSLTVNGNIGLAKTTLNNGTITTDGKMTISGDVTATAGNNASFLHSSNIEIVNGGSLDLSITDSGNSVSVVSNFVMTGGTASITGLLTAGGDTSLTGGTLTLTSAGASVSSLGAVKVAGGTLNLIGSDEDHRQVNALSMRISSNGVVSLDNTSLNLALGVGTLTLAGGELNFSNGSTLSGNMLVEGSANKLNLSGTTTIQGNFSLTDNGTLTMVGNAVDSLSIGGSLTIDSGSTLNARDLSLSVQGTTTVEGTMNMESTLASAFDFGRLGLIDVIDGGIFSVKGHEGFKSMLKGDISLSSPNSTSALTGSQATLENILLNGNISVSADYNHLTLKNTTVQKNVTLAGDKNVFDMTESSINGLLDMAGGTLNLWGANYAKSAAISGNLTQVNINEGATFKVDTTVVKPKGHLLVGGTLDGALLLDGGSATLNGTSASITGDVTVTSGEFTLTKASTVAPIIGGSLHFNGSSAAQAKVIVGQEWVFGTRGGAQNIIMDGNGSLVLNESLTLEGALTGKGQLNISGTGDMTFNSANPADLYTGDIYYSAGKLTLGAANVIGSSGTLNIASSEGGIVLMDVTGNQGKTLTGNPLEMTTHGSVTWTGRIDVKSMTIKGDGLHITTRASTIGTLNVLEGGFTSDGGNSFGHVTAAANATFNVGDSISGNLLINGTETAVTLNDVTATLQSVINEGTLNLLSNTSATVVGSMNSTGTLNINRSALQVKGDQVRLDKAVLENGIIGVMGHLTLTGIIQVTDVEDQASSLSAGKLQIENSGKLLMDKGINTLTVTDTLLINEGELSLRGGMSIGTSTTLNGGSLTLVVAGNATSALSKTIVNTGTLNLSGSDTDHRTVNASSITVNGSDSAVNLDNVYLSLDAGNGGLALNGGKLNFSGNSVLHGHMNVNGSNTLSFQDETSITGNVNIFSGNDLPTNLDVNGQGDYASLKIGGNLTVATNSNVQVTDLTLDIKGRTTVSGSLLIQKSNPVFDPDNVSGMIVDTFTNLGTAEVRDGGSMSLKGGDQRLISFEDGSYFMGSGFTGNITLVNQGTLVSNTLTLDHVYLKGGVTMAAGGSSNKFFMTDSHIEGDLIMEAGHLTLTGTNFAKNAYISDKADLTGDTDTFEVKNTIVKNDGELTIGGNSGTSTLKGILWLTDGGRAHLNAGGVIEKDVIVENGLFDYNGGQVLGNISMTGDTRGVAQINLSSDWNGEGDLSIHSINMKDYGSINLAGHTMRVNGGTDAGDPVLKGVGLAGVGILDISGGGTLIFDATGTHTGDIDLDSSHLVLNKVNALGTRGTLNVEGESSTITVKENQSKNIAGSTLSLITETTADDKTVSWNGTITLDELTVTGNLNLASSGSVIDSLIMNSGAFVSTGRGVNAVGHVLTNSGSSATFNNTDQVTGNVQTKANSSIVFDGTHTNVGSIDNSGELTLKNNADISVTGDVKDTGKIVMNNSNLSASGDMKVTNITTEGTGSSNLGANNMTVSGDLTMQNGTNYVDVKKDMLVDGSANINGSMSVGGELNISADGELHLTATDSATSLGDVSVSGDMTVSGSSSQKKTVSADSMTVNGGGYVELNNINLNLKGTGDMILEGLSEEETATVAINNSTVTGNVITKGDYTDLTMNNSNILGNLEVNGGIFTIKGTNQVSGNATIQENAKVIVETGAKLESGVISLAPNGDLTVNNGGSIGNSSISFDDIASADYEGTPAVSFEGDNQVVSGKIIVNADGKIQAGTIDSDTGSITEGNLTINGSLVGTDHTLHLTTNGENSSIKINSSNDGFSSDVKLDGNLILSANNALGKGGVLMANGNSTITMDNGRNGFGSLEMGKNISGSVLNLETKNNTILSGGIEDLGTLNKTGDKELLLNGGGTITGSFNLNEGSAAVDGSHTIYEMGSINVAAGTSMKFIGESTVKGLDDDSLLTSSGTVLVRNATVSMDIALNGGSLTLDDNAEVVGNMTLNNGELNLTGTGLKISQSHKIILQSDDDIKDATRTINVKEDLTLGGALIVNGDGTLNVSTNRKLYLAGSLEGDSTLSLTGRGQVTLQNASNDFSGTLAMGDYSTLVGETSNAFGSADSTVKINGEKAIMVTGKEGSVNDVTYESKLDSNDKSFELKTLSNTHWDGQLAGKGTMNKTGDGTLIMNKRDADTALTDTMNINVKNGDFILERIIAGNITLSGGTTFSGHAGTTGAIIADSFSSKDAIIEVGTANQKGDISVLKAGSLSLGSSSRYVVDIDILGSTADRILVDGATNLNNATVELRHEYYTPQQEKVVADKSRWTILESGSITGAFSGKVSHDLYYYNAELEQVGDRIDLVLHLNYKGQNIFNINNGTVNNVTNITNVLQHIESLDPDGEMEEVLDHLKDVNGEDDIKKALESIGGVSLTPLMQMQIERNNNHMRVMRSAVDNTSLKMVTQVPDTLVWAQATGDHSELDGDGNGSGYTRDAWGGSLGVEHDFKEYKLQAGLAFSYDSENWTAMGNKNRNNTAYFDFYLRKDLEQWHHYGLLGISQTDIGANRTIAFGDYSNKALGNTSAYSMYMNYEAAYDARVRKDSVLQLVGQIQSGYNNIEGYTESGPIGNAGLSVESQSALAVELGLGAHYYRNFTSIFKDAPAARLGIKALFTYDAADQGADTHACYIADPSSGYFMKPARESRYGGLLGLNLTMPYSQTVSFFMGGTFEVKSGANNSTGNIGVSYSF